MSEADDKFHSNCTQSSSFKKLHEFVSEKTDFNLLCAVFVCKTKE